MNFPYLGAPFMGGWPRSNPQQIRVPHLRDSLIVDKVGNRATCEPLSLTG